MKRFIAAIVTALFATGAYAACSTSTYMYNGKMVICTTCCYGTNCTTTCI